MVFIYSSAEFSFLSPQALEFYTERSNLAEAELARRSKAKRGIKFLSEWAQKTEFCTRKDENQSELAMLWDIKLCSIVTNIVK